MEFDISYTSKEITPWGGMVTPLARICNPCDFMHEIYKLPVLL